MKLVINKCYGGFGLSDAAVELYLNKKGMQFWKEPNKYSSLCGSNYYLVEPSIYRELNAKCEKERNYKEINEKAWYFIHRDIERNDPALIEVVNELGDESHGECAKLSIIEIPDGIDWEIDEYDGMESIAEKHRTWG